MVLSHPCMFLGVTSVVLSYPRMFLGVTSVVLSHPKLPTAVEYDKVESDEVVHPSIFVLEQAPDIQNALGDMLK